MELRCYFSESTFIKLFNLLENLQGKMVYGKMIDDFSFFSLDFGMVITNFPNRNAETRKKGRSGNKTLDTREVASFEAIALETLIRYFN